MQAPAIVTDSNSGITQKQAEEMGVYVLPMTFFINGRQYFEEIDITQKEFFRRMEDPQTTVSTSQPSPGDVMDLWDKVLKTHEELVYIPMSSGLSASCETAMALASDYQGRVHVVNNQRISVTQMQSVKDAVRMAEAGMSAGEIRQRLETEKLDSSIYIMVDTLKYLKKGGRITPAAALIGTVLNLKPVLQIQGEKLDAYAKCRGLKSAKKTMLEAAAKDLDGRFRPYVQSGCMELALAYSHMPAEQVAEWKREIETYFPSYQVTESPLSLSVACHVGPGCLAIACSRSFVG